MHVGDQIMLVSKKYNMFLHVSSMQYAGGGLREVNASPGASSWRVILYAPYLEDAEAFLKAGDVIALFHKECEGYLTKEVVDDDLKEDRVFLEIIRGEDKSKRKNSNSLWMVEKKETTRGGMATYDNLYRFRHLATGYYLTAYVEGYEARKKDNKTVSNYAHKFENIMKGGGEELRCKLTAIKDNMSSATLFAIHPFTRLRNESNENAIEVDQYICLRHANTGELQP